jgi:hypothetical protein
LISGGVFGDIVVFMYDEFKQSIVICWTNVINHPVKAIRGVNMEAVGESVTA